MCSLNPIFIPYNSARNNPNTLEIRNTWTFSQFSQGPSPFQAFPLSPLKRYPWPCASDPYLSPGQTSAQTDHGKQLWPEKDLSGGGGIHKGGNIDSVYLWVPVATSIVQPFTNSIKYTVWGLLPVTAGCTNHCLYQARASCLYQHQDAHRCHWYWLAFNRVMSEIYDTLANERTPG